MILVFSYLHLMTVFHLKLQELAKQLQEDKENLLVAIARVKDLYESSWPLTDAVLSIACQALKGYHSWLTFGRVQQAILFSLGGLVEW